MARDLIMDLAVQNATGPGDETMNDDPFEDRLLRTTQPGTVMVPVFRFRRGAGGRTKRADFGPELRDAPMMLPARREPARAWEGLSLIRLDDAHLRRNRLIPSHRSDPAGTAFDVLRTQIIQAAGERGWRRVAVTAPTPGCGKSFVAANLALSLARKPDFRTVLMDLDLRDPGLASVLGVEGAGRLRDVLSGAQPVESQLVRVGPTLAVALNDTAEADAAEVLQSGQTLEAIEAVEAAFSPDLLLFDLPPALDSDDVLSVLPIVDAVLLVADATQTLAAEIAECERLFDGRAPLLGVVLNKTAGSGRRRHGYPSA